MRTQRINVSEYIKDLLNRTEVNKISRHIVDILKNSEKGTILAISLHNIQYINSTGIDELLTDAVQWIHQHSNEEKYLYLEIAKNEYDHDYNLNCTLRGNYMVMGLVNQEHAVLFGELGKKGTISTLFDTLQYIYQQKDGCNSIMISKKLGIKINHASMYVAKLHELSLVRKYRVNRQPKGFEYWCVRLFDFPFSNTR